MGGVANPGAPVVGGRCSVRPPLLPAEIEPTFLEAPEFVAGNDVGDESYHGSWLLPAVVPIGVRVVVRVDDVEVENVLKATNATSHTSANGPGLYEFRVANEGNGTSFISSDAIIFGGNVAPSTAVPGIPLNFSVSRVPGDLALLASWDARAGALGYNVKVDGGTVDVGNQTSYSAGSLESGSTHTFQVQAYNVNGNGSFTEEIEQGIGPVAPLVTVEQDEDGFNLTLTITLDAPSTADGYEYQVDGGVWVDLGTDTVAIFEFTEGDVGDEHTYGARGRMNGIAGETGEATATISAIQWPPPTFLSFGGDTNGFTVAMEVGPDDLTGIDVSIAPSNGVQGPFNVNPGNGWAWTFSGISAGDVPVSAVAKGNGTSRLDSDPATQTVAVAEPPPPAPDAPTFLVTGTSGTTVFYTIDGGSGASVWYLEYSTNNATFFQVETHMSVPATGSHDFSVLVGSHLYLRAVAHNDYGDTPSTLQEADV